jgi:5-methylcytosine-specific restriction protein B
MLFEKVTLEDLKTAVNDLNQKGIPKGFSTSKYYDVKIDGVLHPPKPIMAIANYYATGKAIDNYFSGGENTPCFNAFKRLGIEIVTKSNNMEESKVFKIIVSNSQREESDNLLNAKLQILQNGYLLLKGSYIYKEPKPSFLTHSYFKLISSYLTNEYVNDTSFNEFYILKKDILFNSPSAAAAMVLNRAANGRNEWKLEDGTTLEKFENKFDFSEIILQFLKQAKTENLKTKEYPKSYNSLKIKVSFGAGNQAKIPWIALLEEPNKVTDGIYPVYLYFKSIEKLILAYGLSETNNPKVKWDINNPTSITNYFQENNFGKPDRYGSSYVYKVYNIDDFPGEDTINDDLDNLLSIYRNQDNPILISPEIKNLVGQEDFEISKFIEDTENSGLKYKPELITRYISSLATKPFVLLSGLSGSGKTKLAQAFAQWIAEDETQYCIVPVGADWTNREPLLGYVNALSENEYIMPENGALKLLIEANKVENKNKPYFLLLDEMNLSHVERYFADFLSVMESKDKLKLHGSKDDKSNVPPYLDWPNNLFIVGTVNIDETTYMFSPKVLDRANVIEFRVNKNDIETFLNAPTEIDFTNLDTKGAAMGQKFIAMASNKEFPKVKTDKLNEKLVLFFEELKKTGAEFGYRSATEIHRLYNQLSTLDSAMLEDAKIDIAIMQKLLPKLHGSRRKLCPILEVLASFCVIDTVDVAKAFLNSKETLVYSDNQNVLYPLSLEKITRMYKGAVDNGFASYAEA